MLILPSFLATLSSILRSRAALELEILALRHQIGVLQRSAVKRPKLTTGDRLLWIWLSRLWRNWRSTLAIVKPETVVAWHRAGFHQLPRYLLRDRDAIFGHDFREQVRDMGICEVLSTPRSPWQRAYIERVIGSVRRECLDHVIVLHESSLRKTLKLYFDYYHRSRTHLSLGKDAPEPRAIQPPEMGSVVGVPQVGGLHHQL